VLLLLFLLLPLLLLLSVLPDHTQTIVILSEAVRASANCGVEGPAVAFALAFAVALSLVIP
jgi:hypothetical protein